MNTLKPYHCIAIGGYPRRPPNFVHIIVGSVIITKRIHDHRTSLSDLGMQVNINVKSMCQDMYQDLCQDMCHEMCQVICPIDFHG
jgi:hypothetical protein